MQVRLIVPIAGRRPGFYPVNVYGKQIASIAGGFTATQATGGWIDDQGNLIVEPVTVFDCSISEDCYLPGPLGKANDFRNLAKKIAQELNQDCVYLSIDGAVEPVKQG